MLILFLKQVIVEPSLQGLELVWRLGWVYLKMSCDKGIIVFANTEFGIAL